VAIRGSRAALRIGLTRKLKNVRSAVKTFLVENTRNKALVNPPQNPPAFQTCVRNDFARARHSPPFLYRSGKRIATPGVVSTDLKDMRSRE
jgi:hypothetical protein